MTKAFWFTSTVALLFGMACTPTTQVHVQSAQAQSEGIVVVGEGDVSAKPDIARVRFGIESRNANVQQALAVANQRMNAILTAVKQLQIAPADIQTSQFSIHYERDHREPVPPPEPAPDAVTTPGKPAEPRRSSGLYQVSNMVQVTVRDLSKLGAVLDAATGAGANAVWGIDFDLENAQGLRAQAQQKAMAHAREQAQRLAQLAGVILGPVQSIREAGAGGGHPMRVTMQAESMDATPIEQGSLKVTERIEVRYAVDGQAAAP